MLMLTSRIALAQQNLDQNTLSLTLRTLGAGVSSDRRAAETHNAAPRPHVPLRVGSEPATSQKQSRDRKLLKQSLQRHACADDCSPHDGWFYSKRQEYSDSYLWSFGGWRRTLSVEEFLFAALQSESTRSGYTTGREENVTKCNLLTSNLILTRSTFWGINLFTSF